MYQLFKNVGSQSIEVFAFNYSTGAPKTGDAANIAVFEAGDGGSVTQLTDTSATEISSANAPGWYRFDLTQGETNFDRILFTGTSSTGSVTIVGAQVSTRPTTGWLAPTTAGRTLDVSTGGEAGVDWSNVGSPTTTVGLSGTTIKAVTDAVALPSSATIAITGNITGNLSGSVGSVTGAVGSVTGNVGGNVTGSIGSLATQAKADVNAEVVDTLNVDTYAQPGQATPASTTTIRLMLNYLYKAWRNRTTQTATEYDLYNDDATTVDQKASFSDNGTTADRGEVATGP